MNVNENKISGDSSIVWHDPKKRPFSIHGLCAVETDGIYRRLPVQTPYPLPQAVDQLASCTSGGQLRFSTDSPSFSLRVKLKNAFEDLSHMAVTGQSGFDVYVNQSGIWQYYRTAIPPLREIDYHSVIWDLRNEPNANVGLKEIMVNFPLYKGVEELWVGLEEGAHINGPTSFDAKGKIIFYGSSITQGGCASRPGMSYTNIISRRINMEMINLGFSGSGKGEKEVAYAIRKMKDPACLVLDYEANCTPELYENTLETFIGIYREWHQHVPIIVLSRIPYSYEGLDFTDFLRRRAHSMKCVEFFRNKGDVNLHFLDGSTLLGNQWHECTVDGVHPNDYGFMKMADGIELCLRQILHLDK